MALSRRGFLAVGALFTAGMVAGGAERSAILPVVEAQTKSQLPILPQSFSNRPDLSSVPEIQIASDLDKSRKSQGGGETPTQPEGELPQDLEIVNTETTGDRTYMLAYSAQTRNNYALSATVGSERLVVHKDSFWPDSRYFRTRIVASSTDPHKALVMLLSNINGATTYFTTDKGGATGSWKYLGVLEADYGGRFSDDNKFFFAHPYRNLNGTLNMRILNLVKGGVDTRRLTGMDRNYILGITPAHLDNADGNYYCFAITTKGMARLTFAPDKVLAQHDNTYSGFHKILEVHPREGNVVWTLNDNIGVGIWQNPLELPNQIRTVGTLFEYNHGENMYYQPTVALLDCLNLPGYNAESYVQLGSAAFNAKRNVGVMAVNTRRYRNFTENTHDDFPSLEVFTRGETGRAGLLVSRAGAWPEHGRIQEVAFIEGANGDCLQVTIFDQDAKKAKLLVLNLAQAFSEGEWKDYSVAKNWSTLQSVYKKK